MDIRYFKTVKLGKVLKFYKANYRMWRIRYFETTNLRKVQNSIVIQISTVISNLQLKEYCLPSSKVAIFAFDRLTW